MKLQPHPEYKVALTELGIHNAFMQAGCLVCRSAVPGRVCPDCYICIACSSGCVECAPVRGAAK